MSREPHDVLDGVLSAIRAIPRRVDLLITALGLLSLVLFLALYDRAFPSAALDLTLSQAEIKRQAQSYLEERGCDLEGYKSAVTFSSSFWTSIYLQRTLGIPEANDLIQEEELPVWYWSARWFRPLQKEEFQVQLAPDGDVIGMSHIVREDKEGASWEQEKARSLARQYLTQNRGWDLDEWEEITASSEERPGGRVDHHFTWKRRDWDVGESQLRVAVTVQGSEVGHYDHWLKVPESFQRNFREQRDVAGFIDMVSTNAGEGLLVLFLILALWKARWKVPWSFSHALPPALAAGAITLLSELNWLPLAKAWYGTTEKYTLFWLNRLYSVLLSVAFQVVGVFALWFAAQWMSKRVWSRQDRILSRRGDRRRHLARSGWRGLMLGMMMAGYAVLFYLLATQILGGWTPMTPDYTYAYATPVPFLGALESGLLPALNEELTYRLLLMAGFLWALRTFTNFSRNLRRGLALLIPGALWAFAHSTYIRDPIYLRGIELTISAVLLTGLFFLRFDLMTTIVAHFVYNAGLGTLPLLRSGDPYFVASGVVVILAMLSPTMSYLLREIRLRLRGEKHRTITSEIRPGSDDDLEALEALRVGDLDWAALLSSAKAIVLCLQAGDSQADKGLVGVAAGKVTDEAGGEVLTVYVEERWRRRYWGSELMDRLSDRLQEKGAEAIQAQVDVENKRGLYFMVSQGWERVAVTFGWPTEEPTLPSRDELVGRVRRLLDRSRASES